MGWTQSYGKDGEVDLLETITGIKAIDLLQAKLAEQGIAIIKREKILLTTDYYGYEFYGEKIYLSDGRIIQHKLSQTHRTDDSGHNHYKWCLSTEIPTVEESYE